MKLELRDLAGGFGSYPVFEDVNKELSAGEWLHLEGPNGAGKTTLLHTIATFKSPWQGEIHFDGFDVLRNPSRFRRRLRYFGHYRSLFEELTVDENWELYSSLFGLEGTTGQGIMAGISSGQSVKNLSRGQKQRVELSTLFPSDRDLILADEPVVGLDENSRRAVVGLFTRLIDDGKIVITASPDPMEEATGRWRVDDGTVHEIDA